jgi:hypothetical protein
MHRRIRTLSIDDQKAVDLCLDQIANAGKTGITRVATSVQQNRLASAGKILALLSELPAADPPDDLVARTMARIDRDIARKLGNHSLDDSVAGGAALH